MTERLNCTTPTQEVSNLRPSNAARAQLFSTITIQMAFFQRAAVIRGKRGERPPFAP